MNVVYDILTNHHEKHIPLSGDLERAIAEINRLEAEVRFLRFSLRQEERKTTKARANAYVLFGACKDAVEDIVDGECRLLPSTQKELRLAVEECGNLDSEIMEIETETRRRDIIRHGQS